MVSTSVASSRSCDTAARPVAVGVLQSQLPRVDPDRARDAIHLHLGRERRLGDAEPRNALDGCRLVYTQCTSIDTLGIETARRWPRAWWRRTAVPRRRPASWYEVTSRETIRPSSITPSTMRIRLPDRVDDTRISSSRVDVATGRPVFRALRARDRLGDDVDLAAEPAAHRAADEVQPRRLDLQDDRRVVEREVQSLRVGVDGDPPVGLRLGDAAGGLGRRVLGRRGLVGALDHVVGGARAAAASP